MDKSDRELFAGLEIFLSVENYSYLMRNQFRRTRNLFVSREFFFCQSRMFLSVENFFFVDRECQYSIKYGLRTTD